MKKELKKLIQVASLPNAQLKTVQKARKLLLDNMKQATDLIHQLVTVNEQIEKKPNKFDEELCDISESTYNKLNKLVTYKSNHLLIELLAHPDHEIIIAADDLIDLIDESKGKIVAKRNPLKGREYSPILS